jgi:drug/metabolite transporter (DMT)-like permease
VLVSAPGFEREETMSWTHWFGIFFTFIGSVMVVVAVDKDPGERQTRTNAGRVVYAAAILYPRALRYGLMIMAFGFLLELIGGWFEKLT